MLFWICIAIWIVGIIGATWRFGRSTFRHGTFDWGDGFLGSIVGAAFGGLGVALLFFGIATPVYGAHHVTEQQETRSELVSLGDNHSQQGRFHGGIFVSYGTQEGYRTVNFVSKQDGYATLGQVYASQARVFEGNDEPSMSRYDFTTHNYWLFPWDLDGGESYDFRVPTGTISGDFAIGNGGE